MDRRNNNAAFEVKPESKEINVQWFLINILIHWKWFLLSIFFCLICGFLYLRYSTMVFRVNASVIIKDDKRGGLGNSELSVYEGMSLLNPNNNTDNEVEMFHSRNLVEDVVREKELYITYHTQGKIKRVELYPDDGQESRYPLPVLASMSLRNASKIRGAIEIIITPRGNSFSVNTIYRQFNEEKVYDKIPPVINTSVGTIVLKETLCPWLKHPEVPLHIVISNPLSMARNFLARLSVKPVSKTSSVVALSLHETNCRRGEDFLTSLIDVYNRDAMEEKNKAAKNASNFITGRLELINEDLNTSESDIEEFRKKNKIADVASESQLLITEDNAFGKRLVETGTQLQLINYLDQELKASTTRDDQLLPATIGVTDGVLAGAINRYNMAINEKQRLAHFTSDENPAMIRCNEKIKALRDEIRTGISGVKASLLTMQKDIRKEGARYDADLGEIPRKQREYREKSRQQQIKENLYIMLLRKKEEAELSLAVTAPSAKIIEYPLAAGVVGPNSRIAYSVALLIGLLIPFSVFGVRENMNYKLQHESDVKKLTDIPQLVVLPQDKSKKNIVIGESTNSPISEMFRLLRTNIQFVLGKQDSNGGKVILVTSTLSGEGKTFVSINLALTFALKYKTLVVGLDIRKPKLADYMDLPVDLKRKGIVSYLSGNITDIDSIILPGVLHPDLDVIPSGVIPPNPNELLMNPELDELFVELRKRYDYIIVDTSPVGSVSDTFLIDRVCDMSLFVLRSGATPKMALSLANDILKENRLKRLNLIFNGLSSSKMKNYGYGYGYGYGSGYREESRS